MAVARGDQPLGGSRWSVYAEAAAGLGIGNTSLTNAQNMTYKDTYFGPALSAGVGLRVHDWLVPGFGMKLGYELAYMPVIKDLIGNTHATGGNYLTFALTYGF